MSERCDKVAGKDGRHVGTRPLRGNARQFVSSSCAERVTQKCCHLFGSVCYLLGLKELLVQLSRQLRLPGQFILFLVLASVFRIRAAVVPYLQMNGDS